MGMGAALLIKKNVEELVTEELAEYKRLANRLRVLNKQSIGMGMHMEFTNTEDKLQDLHSKLKVLPSYMYLSPKEQALETIAHAYLTKYSLGTRAQLNDIRSIEGVDDEDRKLLKELAYKVEKVYDARHGDIDGYEAVLNRMVEIQDIQNKIEHVESVFDIMDEHKPHYVLLLKMRFVEESEIEHVINHLSTSRRVFFRWREKAINEYAALSGLI
ncbi:MAG: hypothetical protein JWM44_1182 [Bacilli bacterium]|nr:hypothetical protein [Bacilli bacterium]